MINVASRLRIRKTSDLAEELRKAKTVRFQDSRSEIIQFPKLLNDIDINISLLSFRKKNVMFSVFLANTLVRKYMSRANSLCWLLASAKRFFLFAALCVPVFAASTDLSQGLIVHYAMDDGTGIVAQDSSGGKNHGTLEGYDSGASGWTTGKIEGALSFDGVNDFVSVPHDNSMNLQTYTVAAWVSVAPGNVIRPIVVKGKFDDGVAATDVPYAIYLSSAGKLTLAYEKASSSQKLAENMSYEANGTGLAAGEIHHVAVSRVKSGGTVTFYVDGQSRGIFENTPKPGDNKKKLYLGLDPKTNKLFKGGLDDVRIYSRALDSSEIQALFDLGSMTEEVAPNPTGSSRNEESVGQPPQTEEGDENSGGSPSIG
ncbi:MAG: hypothetical protein CMI32_03340, partial [Opitutales bacterium]|nr:hypothetical protein [Opitutales bacterium]